MANKKIEEKSSTLKYATIGASLASLAAGTYFFFGPKGKKHQKHAKAWVIKMKGDIIEKLESAKEVTEPIYHSIIDAVATDYMKKMKDGKEDVAEVIADLKKQWRTLSKAVKSKPKSPAKKSKAKKV